MKSKAEELLAFQFKAVGIEFKREFRFHPTRKWRADFVIGKLMIEINGGLWMPKSGHNTAKGIMRDMAKANAAQALGYVVLTFTPQQVKSGFALECIESFIGRR